VYGNGKSFEISEKVKAVQDRVAILHGRNQLLYFLCCK
jgi:hypothetical protein